MSSTVKPHTADVTADHETSKAAEIAEAVKARAVAGQEKVRDVASQVAETGSDLAGRGKDQMYAAQEAFDDVVRRNPTTAVLGAIGIGVLLGMALRGNSRS